MGTLDPKVSASMSFGIFLDFEVLESLGSWSSCDDAGEGIAKASFGGQQFRVFQLFRGSGFRGWGCCNGFVTCKFFG